MVPEAELLPGHARLTDPEGRFARCRAWLRRVAGIEHITGNALAIEQGALYPALYRLEHRGLLDTEWGTSDNNRKAKFYSLTASGRKHLKSATERWTRTILAVNTALRAQEA